MPSRRWTRTFLAQAPQGWDGEYGARHRGATSSGAGAKCYLYKLPSGLRVVRSYGLVNLGGTRARYGADYPRITAASAPSAAVLVQATSRREISAIHTLFNPGRGYLLPKPNPKPCGKTRQAHWHPMPTAVSCTWRLSLLLYRSFIRRASTNYSPATCSHSTCLPCRTKHAKRP